ncbi:hypothetical protein WS68_23585 [Burkholderia sp. TSV86]|nr:hypothetical protein WS68_23585 [Burkholderia sp. TSV86]
MPGQLADLTVLSGDYFSVPQQEIRAISSVLTIAAGDVVHADGACALEPLPLRRGFMGRIGMLALQFLTRCGQCVDEAADGLLCYISYRHSPAR